MRSPVLALTWQVWWRFRWGLAVCAGAWLVLAALGWLLPRGWWSPAGPGDEPLVPVLLVIAGAFAPVIVFVVYAFSNAADVQLEAHEMGFPARTFLLPVATPTLVVGPMLQGTVVVTATWVAWSAAVLRPAGLDLALWWPALLTAALLAWLQALIWWPFPLRYLRVAVAALVLTLVIMTAFLGLMFEVPEAVLAGVLGALIPAAYAFAFAGVVRTRRGDAPQWTWPPRIAQAFLSRLPRRTSSFASPLQAQTWFEWRLRGLGLPFMVSLVLLVWLLMAWTGAAEQVIDDFVSQGPASAFAAVVAALTAPGLWLAAALALPLAMAGVAGSDLGGTRFVGQRPMAPGCHPFLALRPLTDGELVLAKLRMAVRSTLTSWALVLLAAGLWLGLTGKWLMLSTAPFLRAYGPLEVCGGVAAGLAVLVLVTWLLLVGGLWIGLTGRPWLIQGSGVALIVVGIGLGLLGWWLWQHPDHLAALSAALPSLGAAAVVLKLVLAGVLWRALWRRRLVRPRTLLLSAAAWATVAATSVILLGRLVPPELASPSALTLGTLLALPLNGFALAPLALEWNRHR